MCLFLSRGDPKPDCPVPAEHLCWGNRLSQETKMHRKLPYFSQEMWIEKIMMAWYFCTNQRLLTSLQKELETQCVTVPPGAPCNSNVFRQMYFNWSNPSQSTELNNSKMCHEIMWWKFLSLFPLYACIFSLLCKLGCAFYSISKEFVHSWDQTREVLVNIMGIITTISKIFSW